MDLKIFKSGFTETEFNKFCHENIVYKMHFLDSGDVYVFWKSPLKIGNEGIETVELIDGLIKTAQKDIFATKLDTTDRETKLADLREKINKFHTNQKEWNELNAQIKMEERAILMAKETIESRERQIVSFKDEAQKILNTK